MAMEVPFKPDEPCPELVVGVRACYQVPERGGWGYGFGEVKKINKKSIVVEDHKNREGEIRVDKALVYKLIIFGEV